MCCKASVHGIPPVEPTQLLLWMSPRKAASPTEVGHPVLGSCVWHGPGSGRKTKDTGISFRDMWKRRIQDRRCPCVGLPRGRPTWPQHSFLPEAVKGHQLFTGLQYTSEHGIAGWVSLCKNKQTKQWKVAVWIDPKSCKSHTVWVLGTLESYWSFWINWGACLSISMEITHVQDRSVNLFCTIHCLKRKSLDQLYQLVATDIISIMLVFKVLHIRVNLWKLNYSNSLSAAASCSS